VEVAEVEFKLVPKQTRNEAPMDDWFLHYGSVTTIWGSLFCGNLNTIDFDTATTTTTTTTNQSD
jgi:hypothetical protein